jgi:uncharacterized protein
VYAGALAYLVTMTQALHEEIKPDGLRAQVVCPGVQDASLLDTAFRAGLAAFGAQSPGLAQRYRAG